MEGVLSDGGFCPRGFCREGVLSAHHSERNKQHPSS